MKLRPRLPVVISALAIAAGAPLASPVAHGAPRPQETPSAASAAPSGAAAKPKQQTAMPRPPASAAGPAGAPAKSAAPATPGTPAPGTQAKAAAAPPAAAPPSPASAPAATAATAVADAPLPPPAATGPASKTDVIARVTQALTDVKTAQGRFVQTDPQGKTSSGAFYLSRPGRIRFDYDKPEPMFIVSDGVSVSIEEPKRDAYDAVPLASTPLHLFLRSDVDLKKSGGVTGVTGAGDVYLVTLEDVSGEAQGQMILEFGKDKFDLRGWSAVDGSGAMTRVKLSGVETNGKLKPGLFVVRDPADRSRDRNRR